MYLFIIYIIKYIIYKSTIIFDNIINYMKRLNFYTNEFF